MDAKSEAARLLGSIKTEKKAASSRENGKLGGRPRNKATYVAYVFNESGASDKAGRSGNLNALKASIRARYGKGWTVVISKIENDNGIMDFEPVEVARFTLRK